MWRDLIKLSLQYSFCVFFLSKGNLLDFYSFAASNYKPQYTDGSFTMANSNSFLIPFKIFMIAQEKIFKEISLFCDEIVCCVYLLELPHQCSSNEYTQHNIIVKRWKKKFQSYCHLLPDLASWLTLSGSNYPYLEQISMVPNMFEPLRFNFMHFRKKCWTWTTVYNSVYSIIPLNSYQKYSNCLSLQIFFFGKILLN